MGKSYKKKSPAKWNHRDKSIHKKIRRTTDGICRQFENGDVDNEDIFFPEDKTFRNKHQIEVPYNPDDFKKDTKYFQRPPDKRRLDEEV